MRRRSFRRGRSSFRRSSRRPVRARRLRGSSIARGRQRIGYRI